MQSPKVKREDDSPSNVPSSNPFSSTDVSPSTIEDIKVDMKVEEARLQEERGGEDCGDGQREESHEHIGGGGCLEDEVEIKKEPEEGLKDEVEIKEESKDDPVVFCFKR